MHAQARIYQWCHSEENLIDIRGWITEKDGIARPFRKVRISLVGNRFNKQFKTDTQTAKTFYQWGDESNWEFLAGPVSYEYRKYRLVCLKATQQHETRYIGHGMLTLWLPLKDAFWRPVTTRTISGYWFVGSFPRNPGNLWYYFGRSWSIRTGNWKTYNSLAV
jgi:hypothetical protein